MTKANVTVEGPAEYAGVPVTHPRIVATIENMVTKGHNNEDIMRVVGMPVEVIERVRRDLKKKQQ